MQPLEAVDVTSWASGPAAHNGRQATATTVDNPLNEQGQIAQTGYSHLDAPTVDDVPYIGV